MGKINKNDLGYLGIDFQYRLIQQLLLDRKFGESIVDIIKPNYFYDILSLCYLFFMILVS